MKVVQQTVDNLTEQAENLRMNRDYRRALPLYETVLRSEPTNGIAWLGGAECALELGFGERALDLLSELKPFYDATEIERWVNLKSEALRRFADPGEGLTFVEGWEGRVGSQTRAKLLLRKAALLIRQGHREAASRPIRQALETCSTDDPSLVVSFSNVALLAGEMDLAAKAGRKLLRSGNPVAGLYLWLFATFFGSHPFFVRLPLAVGLVAVLLIPALRPVVAAVLAFLAIGILISWTHRMIVLRSSLTVLGFVIGATYALFLLAGTETLGAVLGMLVLSAIVVGTVLVWWKGRKRGKEGPGQARD